MMTQRLAIKVEQVRQACRIHGGPMRLCLALLALKLSRLPIPSRRLRLWLFRDVYARTYPPGLDEGEADRPLDAYPSFNALFTRGMKPECRPIPAGTADVLSPCDGRVQEVGRADRGRLLTLKGVEYSLVSLLPNLDTRPYEGGHFVIIFLSPIDCHRVFSPRDGRVAEVIHVPGARLLVHPPFQRAEYPVYTLNERVILRLATDLGPCLIVMIAGWGVGDITLPFAPRFRPGSGRVESHAWESPPAVKRGDWIATFELGSTVVLIMPSSLEATPLVSPGQEIHYGQPVLGNAAAARLSRSGG
jgi:phosphatidylserine decarboxylase